MKIEELRDKLNLFIAKGYGSVNVIGEQIIEDFEGEPMIEWRYLKDVKLCDRDGHGGAGLNLIFED